MLSLPWGEATPSVPPCSPLHAGLSGFHETLTWGGLRIRENGTQTLTFPSTMRVI